MRVPLFRFSRLCYSSETHWWSVYTHIVYSMYYTPHFNFLCTTPWISLLFLSLPLLPLPPSSSLFLPPPPPLSLSKEETGGGQLTTCQTQSATGAEETAAAAAKEEEEKGREMVICRRNFETITSNHFICNFCNEKFAMRLLKSTPE